ncbi:DUF4391 domain-containing protein [Clostridium felsineum]|uniref:DUF4391 domain-containing protein n=1 Tax=Clostridium felsineum TaxID=36839 RepID=UPI00098C8DB6|nr:DUF4391 domain-containing protein [Clostridium felsineum]URZ03184.1 hypothetical protein CLAUR_032300 [Clostridium felsineum]
MENISEFLGLPKSCLMSTRMPKKAFIDNPEFDLKKEEKDILKEEIDSIYFEYSLKPQLLNVPKLENDNVRYEEIEIFNVKINNENKYSKVCELIQKYIQYPMLIIVEHNNFIRINAAIKKINKVDSSKLVVDEIIYTDWLNKECLNEKEKSFLESLSINNLSTNNIFSIYEGYINCIRSFVVAKYKDNFEIKSINEVSNDIEVMNKITNLENEVISLKVNIKKETNMGEKVEFNVKIKKIEKQIESLKYTLS